MDPSGPKGFVENHVHDHLADFCGYAQHLFLEFVARCSSEAGIVSRTSV